MSSESAPGGNCGNDTGMFQKMRALGFLCLCCLSTNVTAGYDVHVTRKDFWADESGPEITFEEWARCQRSDPQIVSDVNNGPNDFMVDISGGTFPLWYEAARGEPYTKDPSEQAIRKLQEVARCLDARVQGDEGEFFAPED